MTAARRESNEMRPPGRGPSAAWSPVARDRPTSPDGAHGGRLRGRRAAHRRRVGSRFALHTCAGQRVSCALPSLPPPARARALLADEEAEVRSSVEEFPWYPLHRSALACLLVELGRTGEARGVLQDLARDDFAALYPDNEWLLGASLAAEAVARLNETEWAQTLYRQLQPLAGRHAIGHAEGSIGAVDRYLGLLAASPRPARRCCAPSRGRGPHQRADGGETVDRAQPVRPCDRARTAGCAGRSASCGGPQLPGARGRARSRNAGPGVPDPGRGVGRAQSRVRWSDRHVPARGRLLDDRVRGRRLPNQGLEGHRRTSPGCSSDPDRSSMPSIWPDRGPGTPCIGGARRAPGARAKTAPDRCWTTPPRARIARESTSFARRSRRRRSGTTRNARRRRGRSSRR